MAQREQLTFASLLQVCDLIICLESKCPIRFSLSLSRFRGCENVSQRQAKTYRTLLCAILLAGPHGYIRRIHFHSQLMHSPILVNLTRIETKSILVCLLYTSDAADER